MKEVNWQMKESFVFPAEMGQPKSVRDVKVIPRYTADEVEGRPKLTGIYHLAVDVNLTEEKREAVPADESILIDDLEIDGKTGYFEYALPFNIDFPPEAESPVDLKVLNPVTEVNDAGHLIMAWEVACTYQEAGIEQSQKQAEQQETLENEPASEELTETTDSEVALVAEKHEAAVETTTFSEGDEVLDFISQLEDGVSATSFRLNDVLV